MQIDLDLDYKMKEGDKEQFKDNSQLTDWLIRNAVQIRHPKMNLSQSRIWAKIQNRLFEANGKLELDGTQLEWMMDREGQPRRFASRV